MESLTTAAALAVSSSATLWAMHVACVFSTSSPSELAHSSSVLDSVSRLLALLRAPPASRIRSRGRREGVYKSPRSGVITLRVINGNNSLRHSAAGASCTSPLAASSLAAIK